MWKVGIQSISAFFAGQTRKVKSEGKRLRLIDGASFMILLYLVREIGSECKKCVVIRTVCSVLMLTSTAKGRIIRRDASRIMPASEIIIMLFSVQGKAAQAACAKWDAVAFAKN